MKLIKTLLIICVAGASMLTSFSSCKESKNISVKGEVKTIVQGKDGYTALIATKNANQYYAVISRVNMASTLEYQDLKVGDFVTVSGDSINMGDRISITVKSIRK
jgi:uncharacterized protein YdbL (DUF1318 family)